VALVIDLRGNQARLDGWFGPLFFVVGLLVALLTMRAFADEERTGTLELLLTAPVRPAEVIAGKLLGSAAAALAIIACTAVCPWLVTTMADPDGGPIVTGYVGLMLAVLAFTAVGLAVSAATGSPLVAAAGTAALLLGTWSVGLLAPSLTGLPKLLCEQLAPGTHVVGFLRGTLSLDDVVYFLSVAAAGVIATALVLRSRR
jgi:ABC-2 type transport system permease protein